MNNNRKYDIIVWGATGFTGRLVCEYLQQQYGNHESISWAMAGRNEAKLKDIRSQVADDNTPLILADSHDMTSLQKMVRQTKVVLTTVGPYGKYGSLLVDACVENGTHYCDLAGEVLFMRDTIDKHHQAAINNKTKIVHTCGFDSIPSDMGVYFIQKEALERTGSPASQIKMFVKVMKGEMSGGTYASLNDTLAKAQANKSLYKTLTNPYGLNPMEHLSGPDRKDLQGVKYDDDAKSWLFPFIMASINTRVVRRSNALAGFPYGKDFRYEEAMMSGDGISGRIKAIRNTAILGTMMLSKPGSLVKKVVDRVLPKPGEGPDKEKRESGFYNMRFYTALSNGDKILGKVTGDRDPGYGSTSKMLAECGVCLAKDQTPDEYGVITPSVAMGDALLVRLQQNAGLTFSIE